MSECLSLFRNSEKLGLHCDFNLLQRPGGFRVSFKNTTAHFKLCRTCSVEKTGQVSCDEPGSKGGQKSLTPVLLGKVEDQKVPTTRQPPSWQVNFFPLVQMLAPAPWTFWNSTVMPSLVILIFD